MHHRQGWNSGGGLGDREDSQGWLWDLDGLLVTVGLVVPHQGTKKHARKMCGKDRESN